MAQTTIDNVRRPEPIHRRLLRREIAAAALVLVIATVVLVLRSAAGIGVRELQPGSPVRAELATERQHAYRIPLEPQQAARVLVDQSEADLSITVKDLGNRGEVVWDAWERGVESISLIADAATTFELRVAFAGAADGPAPYEIHLASRQSATPDDRRRRQSERLGAEAKALAYDDDAESQRVALEKLREALAIWQMLHDPHAEAATLGMIGDILYNQSRYDEATEAHGAALTLARSGGDRRYEAELLNNLGTSHWQRGRLPEAERLFEEALAHWRALRFSYGEAATLTNSGLLRWQAGDYQQALDRHLEALRLARQLGDRVGEAYTSNNIGVAYRALGDYDAAIEYLERAVPLFADGGEPLAESRALVRLAEIQFLRGDTQRATSSVTRALDPIQGSGDRVAEADALELLGRIASREGDVRAAIARYDQALKRYRAAGSRRGEATALHLIGAAQLALDDPRSARASLDQALAIRREAGLRDAEAETLHQLALVDRRDDRLADARRRIDAAVEIVEDVRVRVAGEFSRSTYLAARQQYYAAAIDLLMQLDAENPSMGFAAAAVATLERARARSLIDLLDDSRDAAARDVDAALLASQREAQAQLNFWSYRVALADRAGFNEQAASARRNVSRFLTEYREADARVRASIEGRGGARTSTMGVREIQRELLDSDSTLLYYFLGSTRSHAWIVTRSEFKSFTLAPAEEIDRAARGLYAVASGRRLPDAARTGAGEYHQAAARLRSLVLDPIVSAVKTPRLLIVADGWLQSIPFAALPYPSSDRLLIDHFEIAFLPSASTLAVVRRDRASRRGPSREVAVVADAVYEPGDPRMPRQQQTSSESRFETAGRPLALARLPFSRAEGEAILALVPEAERLAAFGFDASRELVTSGALEEYRIVHFATHAIHDAVRPELSGVVLSMFDGSGAPKDGFLRQHDIPRIRFKANLVVLASCRSAFGRDVPGEGPIGLARGFFSAGAALVVASLYDADDEATAQLMRVFYEGMLGPQQLRPGAALRAAQLWIRAQDRWREPYWWAGFLLIGEVG